MPKYSKMDADEAFEDYVDVKCKRLKGEMGIGNIFYISNRFHAVCGYGFYWKVRDTIEFSPAAELTKEIVFAKLRNHEQD